MVICLFYFAKSVFYVIKRSYVMANIVGRVLKLFAICFQLVKFAKKYGQ